MSVFQEGHGYYKQTGVGPLPIVLFNGMPFQKEQLDPDELETVTMHKILETTSFFQRAVYLVRDVKNKQGFTGNFVSLNMGLGLNDFTTSSVH